MHIVVSKLPTLMALPAASLAVQVMPGSPETNAVLEPMLSGSLGTFQEQVMSMVGSMLSAGSCDVGVVRLGNGQGDVDVR
jgi:hypothetical protein